MEQITQLLDNIDERELPENLEDVVRQAFREGVTFALTILNTEIAYLEEECDRVDVITQAANKIKLDELRRIRNKLEFEIEK